MEVNTTKGDIMDDMTRKFVQKDLRRVHGHTIMGNFWINIGKVANRVCTYSVDRANYHSRKAVAMVNLMNHDLSVDEAVAEV